MINQTAQTQQTSTLASQLQKEGGPYVNPKGILGKDDFMKLMLIELQYQDPTEPMDTEKILQQTSQLATLEASDNTRKTLESLSKSLAASQQFSVLSAIGKTASLGQDTIQHKEGESDSFDLYFPTDVSGGSITISDNEGNVIKTINLSQNAKGVYTFDWNGVDNAGNVAKDGIYTVRSDYYDANGDARHTAFGTSPVESVRFDGGKALVKLGSHYIPLENIKEFF